MDEKELLDRCRELRLETAQCDFALQSKVSRGTKKEDIKLAVKEWKLRRKNILKEIKILEKEAKKLDKKKQKEIKKGNKK